MTDLVYTFPFTRHAAGRAVTIQTEDGTVVNTGTVTSTPDESLAYVYSATLPENVYTGVVTSATGNTLHAQGKFDIPATIAAAGGGAVETAKFIGTVTADTSGDTFDMVFTQDPDGIVDWAVIDAGNIKLTGPIRFNINARQGGTLDMSGATGFSTETTGADIEGFVTYAADTGAPPKTLWNDYKVPVGTPGDTFAIDAPVSSNNDAAEMSNTANHEVTISATVDAHTYDAVGDPVTDGVYDAVFVVWITRTTLPDLP